MTTFGIIAEGVTDQIVIENILAGYFDDDDLDVRYVQPPLDDTDRGRAVGNAGWGMVFKQFENRDFLGALQFNEFLVVQIDTDVSEQKGYDVPWRDGGRELSPEELIERVIARFRGLIGDELFAQHETRLIFAVAVHQVECWLLPLYYTDNKRQKISGCLDAVNHACKRKDAKPLATADGSKNPQSYREASEGFLKRRTLVKVCRQNPSLSVFIDALGRRFPDRTPE